MQQVFKRTMTMVRRWCVFPVANIPELNSLAQRSTLGHSNNNNNQQQRRSINENTDQLISMLKKQVLMQKKRADAADSEVVKLQKRINVPEEQLSRKFSIDTLSVESIWSEMIDPDTGGVFYMNEETGEMRIADDDENEYNKELDEL